MDDALGGDPLARPLELLEELRALIRRDGRVTLLFGARDVEHSNAVVLRELCARR